LLECFKPPFMPTCGPTECAARFHSSRSA
jgi:hypothetical protein